MISFLNPLLLWALPLASAPLLLHLLFLRRARTVLLGDLSLLREAYRRSLPRSRLRQWLLVAVRCLALAALIVAFARPVLQPSGGAAAAGEEGSAVAVLVDVSYSMGYRLHGKTRLDHAVQAGQAVLGQLKARDRVAVAAFSDRLEAPKLETSPDLAAARAALSRVKPGHRATDFGPALKAAYAWLKTEKAGRKAVVLLTDGAAHGFRGLELAELPDFDPSALLAGLAWSDAPENAAVVSVDPASEPPPGLEPLQAKLTASGTPRPGWEVSLWSRDARESSRRVDLAPGPGASASFTLKTPESGPAWGRVESRQDGLAADDAYHFALRPRGRAKALVLYGGSRFLDAGRGGWFWRKLFSDPEGAALPYAVDMLEAGRWSAAPLSEYRVLVLADLREVPADLAAAAERFVRGGGGLLVVPGQALDQAGWRALERVLPARLGGLRTSSSAYGVVPTGDAAAPGRSRFSWAEFDLKQVAVSRAYDLEPLAGGKVWFRDAAGRPLMAAGQAGAGRAAVWASSLDLEWTNLGLKPAFAAWADVTLGWLGGGSHAREWRVVKVGEPIVRKWDAGEAAPAVVRVRGPEGLRATVRVVERKAEFSETRLPGIYLIEGAGPEPLVWAANVDRSTGESDLTPAVSPPWRPLRAENVREEFMRAFHGREARGWTLALVLLLLLAETFLARPRGTRIEPASSPREAAPA